MEIDGTDTAAVRDRSSAPLASCEARARRAYERGQISSEAYRRLIGIAAEAGGGGEGGSSGAGRNDGESSSARGDDAGGDDDEDGGQRITPCGSPTPKGDDEDETHDLELLLAKYSRGVAGDPDPSRLGRMQEQGFGLSARARRFWSEEEEGGDRGEEGAAAAKGPADEADGDERLLRFMDACLKTYPPNESPASADGTTDAPRNRPPVAREPAAVARPRPTRKWPAERRPSQKRRSRVSKNDLYRNRYPAWDAQYLALIEFKRVRGHCDVPDEWEEDPALARWVQKQRMCAAGGTLHEERRAKLNELGFEFERTGKARRTAAAAALNDVDAAVLDILDGPGDASRPEEARARATRRRNPGDPGAMLDEWLVAQETISAAAGDLPERKKTLCDNPTHLPLRINDMYDFNNRKSNGGGGGGGGTTLCDNPTHLPLKIDGAVPSSYRDLQSRFFERVKEMNTGTKADAKPGTTKNKKPSSTKTGRWSTQEHLLYLRGLRTYGKGRHKKVATLVTTRTVTQIRSHEQKYMGMLKRARDRGEEFVVCCGVQVQTGTGKDDEGKPLPPERQGDYVAIDEAKVVEKLLSEQSG